MPQTSKPTIPNPATRTKQKLVRFAPAELPLVAEFLQGREFGATVRAYLLGQKPRRPNASGSGSDVTLTLAFSSAEWAGIAGRLRGRDAAAVGRALLLESALPEPQSKPQPKPEAVKYIRRHGTQEEADLVREVQRWGVNLNQIAKGINRIAKAGNINLAGATGTIGALLRLERAVLARVGKVAPNGRLITSEAVTGRGAKT